MFPSNQLLLQHKVCFFHSEYAELKFFAHHCVLNAKTLNKKLFHQCLLFFTLRITQTLKGAKSINSFASFSVKTL